MEIDRLDVLTCTIPTDAPEADGTLEWDETTIVIVELGAAGESGLGYTYADPAASLLIEGTLSRMVLGTNPMNVAGTWGTLVAAVRNAGRPGIAACAISALDSALWDLKARLLRLPLVTLLGQVRDTVPVYGSGGFTSYSDERLQEQLGAWARDGMRAVKMKVGRDAAADVKRVRAARTAIGPGVGLYVDANGAYSVKEALAQAEAFSAESVSWFEEPVSSDDLEGLRFVRRRAPAGMDIVAGEYGYDPWYFRRMLSAGAVDLLQADATRCCGITGFLKAAALAEAWHLDLSAHTAPSLHAHPSAAIGNLRDLEYFHDHVRIEHLLFDGAAGASGGVVAPDLSRPGLGLELKRADAERWRR